MTEQTEPSKVHCIGILTSGGDCPGLNATIRGVAKTAIGVYGWEVLGIMDGFTGLVENRMIRLHMRELSGLLTIGGTILGTSRNKPHKMPDGRGGFRDMTAVAIENARRAGIDCLICVGGGGTQKNALLMAEAGLPVVTLPKTIDNDVWMTDVTFGYDSGMSIATEAIDRLHTTASSHHRIMVVGIMGHNAGWLALGAGIAGGADVILIPEIPYDFKKVVAALRSRENIGKRFSIVAVAEGATPIEDAPKQGNGAARRKRVKRNTKAQASDLAHQCSELADRLEEAVGIEARSTSLGHLQRGGIPTPNDRLLATQLGSHAADLIAQGRFQIMVAVRGTEFVPIPLEEVAGKKKLVPMDHPMIQTARSMEVCLGD